ncbi:hypothetical protein [Alteromonas sp. CYL-A6]|uniref:hypothetical protein n=1 Tax=Alteromonas nitratireducens TaxID=3390813 RepID=UPI0034A89098
MTSSKTTLLASTLFVVTGAAHALPDVVSHYPNCDYTVIDTVTASQALQYERDYGNSDQLARHLAGLIERLRKIGEDKGADSIAISAKSIAPFRSGHSTLSLSAQLITDCHDASGTLGPLTPYNAMGQQQFEAGSNTSTMQFSVQLDIALEEDRPDIGDDTDISPRSGMYGLPLGTGVQEVEARFGTPVFRLVPYAGALLVAYGRDHILMFHEDKLAAVTVGDSPFTAELTNHLPFDPRFDDRQWQLAGGYQKGQILTQGADVATPENTGEVSLTLLTESYLSSGYDVSEEQVVGFTLAQREAPGIDWQKALQHMMRPATGDYLGHYLAASDDVGGVTLDTLPGKPRGVSSLDGGSRYYLYDASTLVKAAGDNVTRVYMNPNFFRFVSSPQPWTLGAFAYGQSEQAAVRAAGDDGFLFDHVLTIEKDNYLLELLMEKHDGQYRVYSAELSIYN